MAEGRRLAQTPAWTPAPPARWRRVLGRLCLTAAVLVAAGYALAFAGVPRLVIWERGTSMPTGLYVYVHGAPFARGEVVVLENAPHWGRSYLMKRIEGLPGERFCWEEERGGHRLEDRAMPTVSAFGRRLEVPIWQGCRRLATNEYVGYGSGDSYDSRYFGPVEAAEISGAYRLVLPLGHRER